MGERGPISKFEAKNAVIIEGNYPVIVPRPDANWHPYAKEWYRALQNSPQEKLFESSDWMHAFILADVLSKMLMRGAYSAETLKAWMAGATSLGVTMGDRRRMGIEIKRQTAEDTTTIEISPYDEYLALQNDAPGE